MTHAAKFQTADLAKKFMLAGNARVTLVSLKTGARFTYRIVQREDVAPHFVSLLTGPDNTSSYTFLGTIFDSTTYRHGRKAPIGAAAPSARAFAWAWEHIVRGQMPPSCEVYHEGRCGRCARVLTVPASVESGFGPECLSKSN